MGTDHQEHTFDGLQEGLNYSFTITQTGFSGGRLLSTGPVHAKTIIVGNIGKLNESILLNYLLSPGALNLPETWV